MNRKALFPGSFDPFTAGHFNILNRALTMFDEVVVAVGINQDKRSFFSTEQRLDMIRQSVKGLDGVSVISVDTTSVSDGDSICNVSTRQLRNIRIISVFTWERYS